MIYCDTSATTFHKPPEVAQAVADALARLGNAGRSFCAPAMDAARTVHAARTEVATLADLNDPLKVAFTSGATESLNLVLGSLVSPGDGVITSVLEHNSVLRPLYRIGCSLSFIPCDGQGELVLDNLKAHVSRKTRFVVCTHGSNLTGSVTDVAALRAFCKECGLLLILDASQTMGSVVTRADMADVVCFTGHKALLGPQGTGGIIAADCTGFALGKTGGSGGDSFAPHQALYMPDIFEAGTHNAHGLAGLQAGVRFLNSRGLDGVMAHEHSLTARFLSGTRRIPGLRLYGPETGTPGRRLPVVALNIGDLPADDVACRLWEEWGIATRPGSHCAPLVHNFFGTRTRGMVRFSFGLFTTGDEVDTVLAALWTIARDAA